MDIYRLIKAISRYEGQPAAITKENIDRAIELYFAKSGLMQQGKGWSAETQRQRAGSVPSRPPNERKR
jgi:hypothetical protein